MSHYEWFVTLTAGGLATFLIAGAAYSSYKIKALQRAIDDAERHPAE